MSNEQSEEPKLTTKQKYLKLGLPIDKYECFSVQIVNILYDNLVEKLEKNANEKYLLTLLNMILDELNKEKINDIADFIIKRNDYKKLNAAQFVKNNLEIFIKFGLTKHTIEFRRRNMQGYEIALLKKITNFYGYKLQSFQKTVNKRKDSYYKIKK